MKQLLLAFMAALLSGAASGEPSMSCSGIGSYYWEVGDRNGPLASGSVVGPSGDIYTRNTTFNIASASKWLYGAYVLQTKTPTASDVKSLTLTSGFVDFGICTRMQTVAQCSAAGSNGNYTASADGLFWYGGAHMQKHAADSALGPMTRRELGAAMTKTLGVQVDYSQPQLAGGAVMTPAAYAQFLRKILDGSLRISDSLGRGAVCTNPASCPTALSTPMPPNVNWSYSLGHWVETDGAFSSAGAFGFYPWVDKDKRLYGIVARSSAIGGLGSAACGAELRKAWTIESKAPVRVPRRQ